LKRYELHLNGVAKTKDRGSDATGEIIQKLSKPSRLAKLPS